MPGVLLCQVARSAAYSRSIRDLRRWASRARASAAEAPSRWSIALEHRAGASRWSIALEHRAGLPPSQPHQVDLSL